MAGSVVQLQDYRQAQATAAPQVEPVSLETRKKYFQESQDLTQEARRLAEQDRDYRDHKQWTAFELDKLRKRGQPPIVIDRIARKVDTLVGILERSQSDPRGYPRTPKDEDAAEIATDSLRYVCDTNRYSRIRLRSFENLIVEGICGAEVTVEARNGQPEVIISRIRWEQIFYDPYSREEDFSDARYMGTAKWINVDDLAIYGDEAKKKGEEALGGTTALVEGSYEDRPLKMSGMVDMRKRRLVVVDMYCQHGGIWHRYVFCAGGDLIPGGPSPYLDEFKKPSCPLELQALYVDRENARYGLVRGMLGSQDEINYRRSKWLHLSSTRQTFANAMSGIDIDKTKHEMSRPDGHIEVKAGEFGKDFGIIPTTDMAASQAQLLQEAKSEIELLGPNNSLQGRGSDQQSGKAWLAQQQAGMAEVAWPFAAINDFDLRVYRQIWNRIRQFWTAPKYVRVTDNENAFRFLTVNEPVVDAFGNPIIDPSTGQPALKNRPAEMNVDIMIDSSPDMINSMQEQFDMLVKLRELGEPIPATAIIKASTLPKKREILDAIERAMQAQQPQPDPVELEKLRQGQEKLDQSAVTTEVNAMKTMAQTRQIAAETGRTLLEPIEIPTIQ